MSRSRNPKRPTLTPTLSQREREPEKPTEKPFMLLEQYCGKPFPTKSGPTCHAIVNRRRCREKISKKSRIPANLLYVYSVRSANTLKVDLHAVTFEVCEPEFRRTRWIGFPVGRVARQADTRNREPSGP